MHYYFSKGLFLGLIFFSSCSMVRNVGVKSLGPVFERASSDLEAESSWGVLKAGVPGNLILIEGLALQYPDNEDLQKTAIKGHAGAAFAIYETEYLEDKYAEETHSDLKDMASTHYSKAIEWGEKFLKERDLSIEAIGQDHDDHWMGELSKEDTETILFIAQSLAGLINLNRDKMILVSQLATAKKMYDWACAQDPNIKDGVCDFFQASYLASRPRMLGGDLEGGRKLFEAAIKKWPDNWLGRALYLENYIIPTGDEDLYRTQKSFFNKLLKQESMWTPGPPEKKDPLALYKAVAKKRFKIMQKFEEDIF